MPNPHSNFVVVGPPTFKNRQPRHHIFSSGGTSLHLDDNLKDFYDAAIKDVEDRVYARQRWHYGVWANNQNKFVASVDMLNKFDSRHMEDRWAAREDSYYGGL